ncbi:MAG: ABC transporter ATP-binding protein [Rhizomicrobium sp.]
MGVFKKIAAQVTPALAADVLVFTLLSASLEVLSVWILRNLLLACLSQPNPIAKALAALPPFLPGNGATNILLMMLVGTFLFILVKNAVLALLWRATLRSLASATSSAAWRLFERYLRAPYAVHATRSLSTLQHNLNLIGNQIFGRLVFPSLLALSEIFVLTGILIFLLIKAPTVTVLLALWLAGTMVIFRIKSARTSRLAGKNRDTDSQRILRLTHDSFGSFKSIKLSASEDFFVELFRRNVFALARYLADDRLMVQLPRFVFEPVLIGGLLVLYLILIGSHATQARTLADLTLYAAAAVRLLPAAQRIIGQLHVLAFDYPGLAAIAADFEQQVEVLPDRAHAPAGPPFEHTLVFDRVGVDYSRGAPILHDVSLRIGRGEKIAIIGKTGAGKTTFLNVMLGVIRPTSGRILFDGVEVEPLVLLRQSSVAYVQQDTFLLDGSVAENVAFAIAATEIDYPRVWEALRCAHLDKTVRKFPNGLDTSIGQNGIALSGGERQRLALARAFYQNPAMLVLDEATSQLDAPTEDAILADLMERNPDLTLVMVTHRMSATRHLERRFAVEHGSVIEASHGQTAWANAVASH